MQRPAPGHERRMNPLTCLEKYYFGTWFACHGDAPVGTN